MENEAHKFLQVFFYSHSEEDIQIRDLSSEEKQLMLRIRQEIVNVNPFIRNLTDIIDITGALTELFKGSTTQSKIFRRIVGFSIPTYHLHQLL